MSKFPAPMRGGACLEGRPYTYPAILGLLFLSACAHAQEIPPTTAWDVEVWGSAATGEEHTNSFVEAQTWSAGVFVGHAITGEMGSGWRRGRLEYGFELIPLFAQSRPDVFYGGGFSPVVFRWNSGAQLRRARPYIELSGGALRTTANFPSGDTSNFNFTVRGGGGVYVPVRSRQYLDFGVQWAHISNANLGTRNPEFNGIEVRFGYHWSIGKKSEGRSQNAEVRINF